MDIAWADRLPLCLWAERRSKNRHGCRWCKAGHGRALPSAGHRCMLQGEENKQFKHHTIFLFVFWLTCVHLPCIKSSLSGMSGNNLWNVLLCFMKLWKEEKSGSWIFRHTSLVRITISLCLYFKIKWPTLCMPVASVFSKLLLSTSKVSDLQRHSAHSCQLKGSLVLTGYEKTQTQHDQTQNEGNAFSSVCYVLPKPLTLGGIKKLMGTVSSGMV